MASHVGRMFVSIAALAISVSCGAVDETQSSTGEPQLSTAKERLSSLHNRLNYLDYVLCAMEWGANGYPSSCYLGQGGKYMAFGDPSTDSFTYKYFPSGEVTCSVGSFGTDPAPGVGKTCYFTNLSLLATQGNTFSPYSKFGTTGNVFVAYGGNGHLWLGGPLNSYQTLTCSYEGLGYASNNPSEPNPGGPNDCYQALVGYHMVATEGQSFTINTTHTSPVAYFGFGGTDAQGAFYYANLNGTVQCSASTFGAAARVPGSSVGYCFALDLGTHFVANEGNNFSLPGGASIYPSQYTSGLDGNVISQGLGAGTWNCSNGTYSNLDPDYWVGKSCYAYSLIF